MFDRIETLQYYFILKLFFNNLVSRDFDTYFFDNHIREVSIEINILSTNPKTIKMNKGNVLLINAQVSSLKQIMTILGEIDKEIHTTKVFHLLGMDTKNHCRDFDLTQHLPKELGEGPVTISIEHVSYHRWNVMIKELKYKPEGNIKATIDLDPYDIGHQGTQNFLKGLLFELNLFQP